jgi:hypothetical protein
VIINGNYMSFVDLVVNFDGLQLSAVKSLNYKDNLGRSYVRGTSPLPLGFTTGKYEASFDIELYLPSVGLITINPGWRQIPHVCTIAYGPNVVAPLPFTIDTIAGIYLKELDAPNSDSEDGITRKFSGMVMLPILWNGIPSLIWPSTIGAVG